MGKERFRLIDDSNIGGHVYLEKGDRCLFLYEYTPKRDYSYSTTNQLIHNLKKLPGKKNTHPNQFHYKEQAIQECSKKIAQGLNPAWLAKATFIPVPPAKVREHPEYDDRMLQVCKGIPAQFPINVRELVIQKQTTRAAHRSDEGERPSVSQIANNYRIDETISDPKPSSIGIVDDVLTTGCHFKAMQQVLQNRFPGCRISGIFIARCVWPDESE